MNDRVANYYTRIGCRFNSDTVMAVALRAEYAYKRLGGRAAVGVEKFDDAHMAPYVLLNYHFVF